MNPQAESVLNNIFDVVPMPGDEVTAIVPADPNIIDVVSTTTSLTTTVTEEPKSQAELDAEEDFAESRKAIKAIALEAQTTLSRAVDVAQQIDTPRNFEAVADLIRANLETHQALQGLHKTAAEIRIASKTSGQPTQQVNVDKGVFFNGTPDELLRMIDQSRT